MSPIQQLFLGTGSAVATKTYVDDVFSTYLYKGNGGANQIVNGINNTDESMVWLKTRDDADYAVIFDTIRGGQQWLIPSENFAAGTDAGQHINTFNNNGFTLQSNASGSNASTSNYASWNFKSAPGFFDIVTYTGNGSNRTISHSLGSVPGMIMVKRLDTGDSWFTYHRYLGGTKRIYLNATNAAVTSSTAWNDTDATSSVFSVGTDSGVNGNGATYVAYVFAGGESTAATARSVDFDGSSDRLEISNSSDFSFGSGDFTVEGWFKVNSTSSAQTIVSVWDYENSRRSWQIEANSSGGLGFSVSPNGSSSTDTVGSNCVYPGQWTHFAGVRDGNTLRLFVNGTQVASNSFTGSLYDNTNDKLFIAVLNGSANITTGKISNIRVVKGTAVYTSSFRPPTEPLTNITNTKLLCCNNSSTTGSTVTPGTITANGDPTASSDSPFDDPAAFTFGDAGDQSVISCGSYIGTGAAGNEVFLGWEPQLVMFKNTSHGDAWSNWFMYDSMRGVVTGGTENYLMANKISAEEAYNASTIDFTSTGFTIQDTGVAHNGDGDNFIFLALRRSDGYVGKPPSLGTGVFAMDTWITNGDPAMISNFPVDFVLDRDPTVGSGWQADWHARGRLIQTKYLKTNSTDAGNTGTWGYFDYSNGWLNRQGSNESNWQSWMFKRGAGFDVVTYQGDNNSGHEIPHSLNKTVEMAWIKNRNAVSGTNYDWICYHHGVNGGTNPEQYYLSLNDADAQTAATSRWNNTAPSSTHITLGNSQSVNGSTSNYLMMLFASVSGISKCGFYDGSDSTITITTGFAPRFVILKRANSSGSWFVLDTTRGWGSGNDEFLLLNSNAAQDGNYNLGEPTATGFTLTGNDSYNNAGDKFIYYAHA